MHHSSTSTYIEIEETFFLWTDQWTDRHKHTYGRADEHLRPTLLGRLGGVNLIFLVDVIIEIITRLITELKKCSCRRQTLPPVPPPGDLDQTMLSDVQLLLPPSELDETYASSLIRAHLDHYNQNNGNGFECAY